MYRILIMLAVALLAMPTSAEPDHFARTAACSNVDNVTIECRSSPDGLTASSAYAPGTLANSFAKADLATGQISTYGFTDYGAADGGRVLGATTTAHLVDRLTFTGPLWLESIPLTVGFVGSITQSIHFPMYNGEGNASLVINIDGATYHRTYLIEAMSNCSNPSGICLTVGPSFTFGDDIPIPLHEGTLRFSAQLISTASAGATFDAQVFLRMPLPLGVSLDSSSDLFLLQVPEGSTAAYFALGLLAVGWRKRHSRKGFSAAMNLAKA